MELSTRDHLIMKEVGETGATIIRGIDKYLKEINNQLTDEEFYHEHPTDTFEYGQNIIINSLNNMIGKI